MKKSKIFAALALSACMALGAFSFAACTPGKSAYDIAVENGFEGTEQEWLESLKGESVKGDKGDDAVAPEIEIGENGNWFIDGVDTGIKAQGEKGDKGDKGDAGETGAKGDKGDDGEKGETGDKGADGANGSTWYFGAGNPAADAVLTAKAKEGDLYLDTKNWDIYAKSSGNAWTKLGNIKGEKGDKGDKGDPGEGGSQGGEVGESVVKDFGSVTISASGTQELDLTGVEAGTYYLIAETSGEAANAILSSITDDSANHNGSSNYIFTCDMYAAIKGEYRSAVIINDGTKLSLKNSSSDDMVANVKLVELTVPTIEAGIELDIPAMNSNNGYVEIPVSENLIGKTVRITIKNSSVTPAVLDSAKKTLGAWKATDKQDDGSYQKEFTLSDTCTSLYFRNSTATYCNLVVLFEVIG